MTVDEDFAENVANDYLIVIHQRTHARDRSIDPIVFGDLMRPEELAAVFFYGEKIAGPIGEVNCFLIHGRSSGNIATGCERPFWTQVLYIGRID
jgi:hypothetical protein